MSMALAPFNGEKIQVKEEQIQIIRDMVSQQNPTDAELLLYFHECDRRGVHPLDKLIYFTKKQGQLVLITSIDYMRMRAETSGQYAGSDDAVFDERGGKLPDGKGHPYKATVSVWKIIDGQRVSFSASAYWDEYYPGDANKMGFMWKKLPHGQLSKCAEALALRKGFPGTLNKLYVSEEMDQATHDAIAPTVTSKSLPATENKSADSGAVSASAEVEWEEGGLKYRESDGIKFVLIGRSWQRVDKPVSLCKEDKSLIAAFFKDDASRKAHLKENFGTELVSQLKPVDVALLIAHMRDGIPYPKVGVTVADIEKVSIAYGWDKIEPWHKEFAENVLLLGDYRCLFSVAAKWEDRHNEELVSLAKILAVGTLVYDTPEFWSAVNAIEPVK